tara:strand:+ start:983 stop:1255 length:273 start_codon:yes stop_codon:yes gene_type:complete
MQEYFDASKLEKRREAIRLPIGEFCKQVGMHPSTWEKYRAGSEPRLGTARNVISVIETDELKMLEHLIKLHPETATQLLAALQADKQVAA